MINIIISAYRVRLKNYFIKLYFVKVLNRKISLKKISRVKTLQYQETLISMT